MQKFITNVSKAGNTTHLPAYAQYLLDNQLLPFQKRCFQLFKEAGVPLFKYFKTEDAEALSYRGTRELLVAMVTNSVANHIQKSVEALFADQLPQIESSGLVVDDITSINHARKLAFLEFIPGFTSDIHHVLQIAGEIESYAHEFTTSAFKALLNLSDQKMSEQLHQLAESERQFRQAQALTHIGSYTWELASDELTWSDELYRIYGLDPLEQHLPRESVALYNHPDDVEIIRKHTARSIETGEPFDFFYRIVMRDGQIKTLHALGEVVTDEHGKAIRIFGTAQDVTERQKLLHKLQTNEQLYRQIETIAHVGGWYWDVEEDKVIWTDELCRIYGIEPQSEDITFESYLAFIHPEDREMVMQTVQQAMETGKPYTFHHRIRPKVGKTKILYAQGETVTDAQGRVIQMMGSAQDVTAQKKAEARLMENQHFIKKIANSTPAIISTYEVDSGRYTFINLGLKKNLNYEPQEALDQGISFFVERVHPDDIVELSARNEQILLEANQREAGQDEEVFDYRYRLRHRNGHYRWFHTYGTVFERTKSNQVKQVLNITLDITERIEAEQVLLQRTRELQLSNASLEEFAYITSHDLKEPLRKISLFVERLSGVRSRCTEEEKIYFDKILDASGRMRQMIDDILSLSLLSNKREPEQISLQTILDTVLYAFEDQIASKGAIIESDGLPVVRVIPQHIDQLFQNLISNSLKFCRTDIPPRITIQHSFLTPSEVKGPVAPAARYVRIVFRDNGIGFENHFQEKIFAVFQRLHHRHQYEGTGIGLAICKKIVTSHGGTIEATGQVNQGAEFTITLPV